MAPAVSPLNDQSTSEIWHIKSTSAKAFAHGVAANRPINQSLAKSLHEQHPSMYQEYHQWCRQNHPKPGRAWAWGGIKGGASSI